MVGVNEASLVITFKCPKELVDELDSFIERKKREMIFSHRSEVLRAAIELIIAIEKQDQERFLRILTSLRLLSKLLQLLEKTGLRR